MSQVAVLCSCSCHNGGGGNCAGCCESSGTPRDELSEIYPPLPTACLPAKGLMALSEAAIAYYCSFFPDWTHHAASSVGGTEVLRRPFRAKDMLAGKAFFDTAFAVCVEQGYFPRMCLQHPGVVGISLTTDGELTINDFVLAREISTVWLRTLEATRVADQPK